MSVSAPPAPRSRRRARWALAVLALTLVAACASGDDGGDDDAAATPGTPAALVEVSEADLGGFPGDPDDFGGPGTPLGAGLSVPEGALLQGTTFPDLVGGGFRALLLVVGDPVAVYDDLVGQAIDLGMAGAGGCLGAADQMGCSARLADPADGESLVFGLARRVTPAGVVSGLGLQYRPPGSEDVEVAPDTGVAITDPLPEVVLPDPVPDPDVLDVGVVLRTPGTPMRTVEAGSELVGLAGPCACDGPGWSYVVELTGVERDVIAGYGRQFTDLGEPPDVEDTHRDDVTLVGLRVGEGDAVAEIRASLPDTGTPYAIVTVRPG